MFGLVILDLDGTITRPKLDFQKIKKEMGAAEDEQRTTLEFMDSLPPDRRRRAEQILAQHERDAAQYSQLRDGARELIVSLRQSGVRVAILTRNSRLSVETVLRKHSLSVDFVLTREDSPPKPSAEPVLRICRALGVPPAETLVVGDFRYDIMAGQAAGAKTALLTSRKEKADVQPDHVIHDLHTLRKMVRPSEM